MGRRWWQKEARRIQNEQTDLKIVTATSQEEVVEMNDESAVDAINELNEVVDSIVEDSIENEDEVIEDAQFDVSEGESFEDSDVTEDEDAVEDAVVPAVTNSFNQNVNSFNKKKKRR